MSISNELGKIGHVYGDVCLRTQRRKRQKLLIIELFLDYAKHSTLHGLRYITETSLTIIEKLFWALTFVVSVILCSYLISNVYMKWKNSPVIVTVSDRLVSVGEVPFPSVTICPQIKSMATTYNFSEKYETVANATDEDKVMFDDVAFVCNLPNYYFQYDRNFTDVNLTKHIDDVSPGTSDTLALCIWQNKYMSCDNIFQKVYTEEGLCFNMNGLAAEEMFRETVQKDYNYSESSQPLNGWSLVNGYLTTEPNPFPGRGSENGAYPDLQVLLTSNEKDSDGLCNGLNSGYKIYIQHPADHPQSSVYYYAALDGQVSSLALNFNQVTTDDALESYSIEDRQCYFPKDRSLRYFKIYTAKNCRAECLSNYTYETCNCVGYYMPHDNSSQLCARKKMDCIESAHVLMASKEREYGLKKSLKGCRCLPACNTVEYDAEILKTDFHIARFLKLAFHGNINLGNITNISKIDVSFKKPQFVSMRRSELFGLTDFLANIGGLLGVFLGFSFLSLVEILYFITLRVGLSLNRDLKEEKKNRANIPKIVEKNN